MFRHYRVSHSVSLHNHTCFQIIIIAFIVIVIVVVLLLPSHIIIIIIITIIIVTISNVIVIVITILIIISISINIISVRIISIIITIISTTISSIISSIIIIIIFTFIVMVMLIIILSLFSFYHHNVTIIITIIIIIIIIIIKKGDDVWNLCKHKKINFTRQPNLLYSEIINVFWDVIHPVRFIIAQKIPLCSLRRLCRHFRRPVRLSACTCTNLVVTKRRSWSVPIVFISNGANKPKWISVSYVIVSMILVLLQ